VTTEKKKKLQDAIRELRELYYRWVAADIQAYPHRSYSEIGLMYGLSEGTVYQIARLQGISRNAPKTEGVADDRQ
jgi:DNA-directed RNA polymerase specialized sigma subunit